VVVVTAWWLIGLAISARNGLGLRFAVGNAGVVVVAWACDLDVVVAWACDLGVVVAWACRSCGSRPGFADLAAKERRRSRREARTPPRWPRREARTPPRWQSLAMLIPTVWRWSRADLGWRSGLAGICLVGYFWLLRNFICGGFWLLRNKILWWFLVALVDLRWLWWWRGGKDYGSWLFLVRNNNTKK
jgi:hypothetical protein